MGFSRYTHDSYVSYASVNALHDARTTRDDRFRQNTLQQISQYLNPHGVRIRESRDSEQNPNSTAIIIGIDVTGSMGMLADELVLHGADVLIRSIYERRPVTDPHVMYMAIGDMEAHDQAPLQVSQFEPDIRMIEQLRQVWLEGGGGGNQHESYALPWYFAAYHTSIDCFEKRGKKGYLFTMGDERPQHHLPVDQMERIIGYRPQISNAREVLRRCQEKYEVFHLIVEEGSAMQHDRAGVIREWQEMLGDRAILLPDHKRMAEVVTSIIQVNEGADLATAAAGWEPAAQRIVESALTGLGRRRIEIA